jgi:PilZ domain
LGDEHRRHPRIARPLEASWLAASGEITSRVSDISLGGCFFQSLVMPSAGDHTMISVRFTEAESMSFQSEVVYAERGIGFAVRFIDLSDEDRTRLQRIIEELAARQA